MSTFSKNYTTILAKAKQVVLSFALAYAIFLERLSIYGQVLKTHQKRFFNPTAPEKTKIYYKKYDPKYQRSELKPHNPAKLRSMQGYIAGQFRYTRLSLKYWRSASFQIHRSTLSFRCPPSPS